MYRFRSRWARSSVAASAVLALGLSLAACGDSDDDSDDSGADDTATETVTESPTDQTTPSDSGSDDATDDGNGGSGGNGGKTAPDADLATAKFKVDTAQAFTMGQQKAGDGTTHKISIEYENDDAAWVWKVETDVGGEDVQVEIDADTGKVIRTEKDRDDDSEPAVDPSSPMTPEQAMKAALDVQQGTVQSWSLESDDGAIVYEIEVDSTDVIVDVESGDARIDD